MSVIVPLAPGFEEIEAVTVIDVLRRAQIKTTVVGLGVTEIRGSHGVTLCADSLMGELDNGTAEGIVLPGGMPGASNLREDKTLLACIQDLDQQKHLVAAICAAPIVLEKAGILHGKRVTCYPGFEDQLISAECVEGRVVRDGHIVTGCGPGAALEFALEIVAYIGTPRQAEELAEMMLIKA